jgi:Arc/MetJ-type ribon-helix-helix transcriptional regulator
MAAKDHQGLCRVELWLRPSVVDALDEAQARHEFNNRSSLIREYLMEALRRDGLWPPSGRAASGADKKESERLQPALDARPRRERDTVPGRSPK